MVHLLTADEAFSRYQSISNRFPALPPYVGDDADIRHGRDLGVLACHYDAFVFDAFGVLNVGETPIQGACERIEWLRSVGKRVFVLTNAASYTFDQVVDKFKKLGFAFDDAELISSRAVCEAQLTGILSQKKWGVIAPSTFIGSELDFQTIVLGDDLPAFDEAEAFLFLSTECWSDERQRLLKQSLVSRPRPVVVANPDLVAPREAGLTVEPGYYAHDLMDALPDLDVTFHGKPFASVYDRIEQILDNSVPCHRITMMGDSLHTDIWGARVRGWGSVLVSDHGFLKGQNVEEAIRTSGIYPDWIVPSI